jgi:hypothetical protein
LVLDIAGAVHARVLFCAVETTTSIQSLRLN